MPFGQDNLIFTGAVPQVLFPKINFDTLSDLAMKSILVFVKKKKLSIFSKLQEPFQFER